MRKFLIRTSNNDSIDGEMDVKCEKENGSYKQLSKQKVQTHEKGDTSLIDERECANHFRQESPNDKKNESWDSIQRMNNSFSTVESSTTINTLRHFGLSNHPGKSVDNVIIDAFMDLQDENESHSKHRNLSKVGNLKPYNVDSKHDVLLHRALSCIAKRDFKQLMSIVEATPAILLCPCKKNNEINDSLDDRYQTRGCYGGTILHVLASQKPSLKKKRVNGNKSMKDRLTNALSFSQKDIYELHIMPSVPPTILSHIIKMEPNALQMIDDIGRLPIHCATLSQSIHLGEINKILTSPKTTNLDTKSSYEISRIIVREINLTDILIRHYREGAYVSDLKGNLPIHYAASMGPDYSESENIIFQKEEKFRKPSAMNTISQLIEVFPKSLEIPNKEGNLPIHMACARGSGINLSVLEILVSHHNTTKDILSKKNNNGDPPLFVAIKSRIAVDVVFTFASHEIGATTVKFIFSQRDASNNNLLQVALQLIPSCDSNLIAAIMKVAPFTASTTDSKGVMPIRYATRKNLPEGLVRKMLERDMPIQIGAQIDSDEYDKADKSVYGLARHIVGRSHNHSWWHVLIETNAKYISMVKSFLQEEATHSQIVMLARQIGPDGSSSLVNCISNEYRILFHELLQIYGRYEILLSTNDTQINPDEAIDGVHTFLALDHGLSLENRNIDSSTKGQSIPSSCTSISTAVRIRNDIKTESEVEISLISKEKSKVVLRCYAHDEAFFAEVKVREKYDFPKQYFEELYNYHHDGSYTYLTLSRAERLQCISFERPDHTLEEVFASVSSGGRRSQKWIEKCWIVLKQIATALKYLHNENLIHGHLDSPNIAKFGNIWKITKLGTLTPIGSTMRGTFRPCAPPESIVISCPSASTPKFARNRSRVSSKSLGYDNHVKFTESTGEMPPSQRIVESRDDIPNSPSRSKMKSRQGIGNNNLMSSFLGLSSPFNDQSKDKRDYKHSKKNKHDNQIISFNACSVVAHPSWDIWSFGLVMVQLLLGRCMALPNFEKAEDAILKKLHKYDDDSLGVICNQLKTVAGEEVADLVHKLLQKDPKLRPKSFDEILAHGYFEILTLYV